MSRNWISSWNDVLDRLADQPWRSRVHIRKGVLPHPRAVGMKPSMGLPVGQSADYRLVLEDGVGLHVQDFGDHYEVHLDEVHPDVNLMEHLRRDAPGAFVASGAAFGAVVGNALSGSRDGALVGGFLGALLAAMAANRK